LCWLLQGEMLWLKLKDTLSDEEAKPLLEKIETTEAK
jgi:hypothetical protein